MARVRILAATLITALAVTSGCSRPPAPKKPAVSTASMSNGESQISSSLQGLLQRSDDGAFVIVEDKSSGKFVQFVGSANEPLLLDLPAQTLSSEERSRAHSLFADVDGSTETESGFQVAFDRKPEEAARMAMRVFREVYLFDDNVELTLR